MMYKRTEPASSERDILDFVEGVRRQTRDEYESLASLPLVYFPRSVRLPRPQKGWFDVAYAVTVDGLLAIMRADLDVKEAWKTIRKAKGSREDLRLPPRARARLSLFDGVSEQHAIEIPLLYPFPFFDQLADGSWLIADNIARKGKPNAGLFSAEGTLISELALGGDIEHLQADPDGGFWIGYGDRGVFSGPHRVEAGGIVRFDAGGKPVWNLNESEAKHCHAWCDHSYALNISAFGRWCYTYTEFLLTRLDADGGPHSLRPKIEFSDAVAVKGDRIMMAGGTWGGRDHGYDRLVLLGEPGRWTPRRPRIEWIGTVHRAVHLKGHLWTARGDTLHCVRGKTWHRLSIDEADALVPPGPWRL